MSNTIKSGSTNDIMDVNADKEALVALNQDATKAGFVAIASENDDGTKTLVRNILSPETDQDYRLRVAQELVLDQETFNYTPGQNTGKHSYTTSTMTNAWNASGLLTNATSITTTTTGTKFNTYAMFPYLSSGTSLYIQGEVSFSAQPVSNLLFELGYFASATALTSVTDGVLFRLTSGGLFGVINHNGSEITTSVFSFTLVTSQVYKFVIVTTDNITQFWIDDILYGSIPTPVGQGQPFMSAALPLTMRHAILGGAAGGVFQATLRGYSVSMGGVNIPRNFGELGNATYGSYQGLSGGTMGQLVAGTVTSGTLVKPTAAIPANTSLVANLPSNLGGRIYEQLTSGLAANVDAIFSSYTVPAGTVSIPGRRLKLTGIKLSGMVSTVVVGGPAYTEWYIAFGHTADSLATTESNVTKAPRRVMLPELTANMAATAAAGTLLPQPAYVSMFPEPIYVNPGERVQLVGNKTITSAITSGVLSWTYQFIYSWE